MIIQEVLQPIHLNVHISVLERPKDDGGGGEPGGGDPTPEGFTYLRPDGVSFYLRPDGVSTYIRPA